MSIRNEIIKFVMKQRRKTMEKQEMDLFTMRRFMDNMFIKTFIVPWTVSTTQMLLAGQEAEIITPEEVASENSIILYVHGGGYFMGSIDTHRSLAGWIAHESNVPVAIFNYRLAPEHPFPAGRDDVIRVYSELLKEYDARHVALVGDSAGGGLILQALLAMKPLGMKMPVCCCLLSPFLDLTCSAPSVDGNAESDPFIVPKFLRKIIPHYLHAPYHAEHPEANPLHADLSGLPPMLVHAGSIEVLVDDSRNLAARCAAQGVDCEYEEYEGLPHVWHFNKQFFMPEADEALREVGAYLHRHMIVRR